MTAVKWAIFLVALLTSNHVALWLRPRPAIRIRLWTLVGVLPFLAPFNMGLYSFPARASDTPGFEVALIDWLVLCLALSAAPSERPAPYRFTLFVYFVVVLVSITQARWPLLAAAYAWRVGRMILLVLAIWRAGGDDRRVPAALMRGMLAGVVFEGGLAAWQHFVQGMPRAEGTFSGWNSLGLVVNLIVMVPVARILAGPTSLLTKLAPMAAVIADLLSVSRGALLFLGLGVALVWLGSALKESTPRKAWFGVCGLLVAAVIVPVAISTVESRTAADRSESLETRRQLQSAAAMMLDDHPLGVGASHFVPELLHGGYGERAELGWRVRISIVHSVYWVTAAELGYGGVVALLLLFLDPLRVALLRRPGGRRGDVLLGLGIGLAIFSVHCGYEWAWRLAEVSYPYFMTAGMVAVVARQPRSVLAGARRLRHRRAPERVAEAFRS